MNELQTNPQELAHKCRMMIDKGRENIKQAFLDVGAAFYIVSEKQLYKLDSFKTMDEYIYASGFKKSWVYNAMRAWREFGTLDTTGIQSSRLIPLASLRLADDEKVEALSQARELTFGDFRKYVRAKKTGLPQPENCPHTGRTYTVCCDCNSRIK